MPDLEFTIESAEPLRQAAAPHIAFQLRITAAAADDVIHSIILRCQVQLEVQRRQYSEEEQDRLRDLLGRETLFSAGPPTPHLTSMLWTNTHAIVPQFEGVTTVELQVPCTFDFNIAATKYFSGIEGGDVPVAFYFSGTLFHGAANVQAMPIPWDKEATYRLPIRVWRDMMELYYPNTAWLCLQRDAFERLYAYKVQHGIPTFEQALEAVIR
jgi:hypothetical protein